VWLGGWPAQYAKVIQRLEFPATFKDFKVQNIVGSCDVRFPIRLEGLAYSHGMFCSVRPPPRTLYCSACKQNSHPFILQCLCHTHPRACACAYEQPCVKRAHAALLHPATVLVSWQACGYS